ncbi:hypothetical protein K438DRAFT_2015373 [Mycena galopus ATCC 62051]|nr:hypothetical protein K438DRAFT_2015373 [Mycena galopus ATCC 62051]
MSSRCEIDFCALQVRPSCSSVPLQAHRCLEVSMFGVVHVPQVALSFNGAREYWREENCSSIPPGTDGQSKQARRQDLRA